jgi:hypothetical protein
MLKRTLSLVKQAFRSTHGTVILEESPERYCPGGYHPIFLGMKLNDRYRIQRKLVYTLPCGLQRMKG